jgi:hypothetical protein
MSRHEFHLRLSCSYRDPDNSIDTLEVEVLTGDGWQSLDLSPGSPGFLLFVYTLLHCQHTYMRVNCAERKLMLASATGSIDVGASEQWVLERVNIEFAGRLKSGSPARGDTDYIVDRMRHCPVSMNLRPVADSHTRLILD